MLASNPPLIGVLLGLLGVAFGSFLNVLVPRLAADEPITGRSHCPHCRHELPSRDLIPLVSFVLLRGRCRSCRGAISWRYPVVEVTMAAAFLILWWRFGTSWELLVYAVLSFFLLALFLFDLIYTIVPDEVSLPAAALALVGSLLLGVSFTSLAFGGILGAGFFALQYFISRGRWVGDGDIRLGLLAGFALGFQRTVLALVLAYFSGAIIGGGLLLTRRVSMKSQLPFGTLLTAAVFISLLFGDSMIDWYSSGGLFRGLGLDRIAEWFIARGYQ